MSQILDSGPHRAGTVKAAMHPSSCETHCESMRKRICNELVCEECEDIRSLLLMITETHEGTPDTQ